MGEVVVTVKPTGEPWVVFHAAEPKELVAMMDAAVDAGVYEAAGRGTEAIRTRALLGQHLGAVPVGSEPTPGYQAAPPQQSYGAPQGAYGQQYGQPQGGYNGQAQNVPQLPPGEPEVRPCPHGGKFWKAGVSRQGKPYGGWMCSSPDRQNQCPPEYPRR